MRVRSEAKNKRTTAGGQHQEVDRDKFGRVIYEGNKQSRVEFIAAIEETARGDDDERGKADLW